MPLFRPRNELPEARFDPDMGDSRLTQLREIVAARDWLSLEFYFEQIDNWSDQSHYLHCFSELPGTEHWLLDLVKREDQGTLAPLLLAARRIAVGWSLRRGQFAAFHAELAVAEQILAEITESELDNAAAWALQLRTATGLGFGLDEAERRYENATAASPHHLTAQLYYLECISPRWGGNLDLMHAFARESALAAPPGGRHGELLAMAHLEHFAILDHRAKRNYFRQPAVAADLQAAAERSVLHPDYGGTHAVLGHSTFAMAYFLAGEHAAALEQFSRMGGTAVTYPWSSFYLDPEGIFLWARGITQRKG